MAQFRLIPKGITYPEWVRMKDMCTGKQFNTDGFSGDTSAVSVKAIYTAKTARAVVPFKSYDILSYTGPSDCLLKLIDSRNEDGGFEYEHILTLQRTFAEKLITADKNLSAAEWEKENNVRQEIAKIL
jgi:hypothetical protein